MGLGPQRPFPSPRAEARAGRARHHRPSSRQVFVDDTGRRRRLSRRIGTATGGVVVTYLAVVALTFAGVPGLGELHPPGLGQLTNPSGDGRPDMGPDAQVQSIPAEVADALAVEAPDSTSAGSEGSDTSAGATTTTAPTTTLPPTTTTVTHGNGDGTPNSTVPDPPGGPPTSRPGRP